MLSMTWDPQSTSVNGGLLKWSAIGTGVFSAMTEGFPLLDLGFVAGAGQATELEA
jgi:hypothetical protein